MNAVTTYIKTLLAPRLRSYGLNKEQRAHICNDVQQRLVSLLRHWDDENFRKAILILGEEEGTFWAPAEARLEIRALVVLCIRNSFIENLHAVSGPKRQVVTDNEMPHLTGEAIEFFEKADLTAAPAAASKDIFDHLPALYPHAWQCLTHLSQMTGQESFPTLRQEKAEPLKLAAGASPARTVTRSASGMDFSVDRDLSRILTQVQQERGMFFTPSFARLTRHPVKLMAVIDHVVRNGGTFTTCNYVMANGYIAKRSSLVRPPHDVDEAEALMSNGEGLAPRHRSLLGIAPKS